MLKLSNVSISYGSEAVVNNVTMCVKPGEVYVISGVSGCGKSTIIKAINGIIPHFTPAQIEGSIHYKEHDVVGMDMADRSSYIASVFQNPKNQFYANNTSDEMAFSLENKKCERSEILSRIEKYTKLLHTTHLLNRDIFKLSGGEKQMVAITSVACMNVDVYLFDEPSSSLDATSITHLLHAIRVLKELGKIVIIAEHRLYYVKDIMDCLCIVKDKKLVTLRKADISEELLLEYHLRSMNKIELTDILHHGYTNKSMLDKTYDANAKIVCTNYSYSYTPRHVVFDMNLSFENDVYFLIGKNGIGKTTFIRSMCGLQKRCKGKCFYHGIRIKKAYQSISIVMQDVNYQLFTESVWEELSIVSDDEQRKTKVLSKLGLIDKKDVHPHSLSGGEKQRLAISLCMVSNKPIVILDEPTSGLCKMNMMKIIQFLHMMKDEGKTILIITHDYEFIHACGGHILHFE